MPSSRRSTVCVVAVVVLAAFVPLGAATAAVPTAVVPMTDDSVPNASTSSGSISNDSATAVPDATVEDGGTYWLGQTLAAGGWSDADSVELQVASDGSWAFVTQLRVNGDEVVLNTDGLDPGRYRLVGGGDGRTVAFALRTQSLDVTLSESTVWAAGESSETTTNVSIRSNRTSYDLAITASDLDASTLRGVLGEGEIVDSDGDGTADAVVVSDVATNAELTADFSRQPAGNHTLAFAPVDAAANANATVTVQHVDFFTAGFNRSVHRASDDGVVRIPIDLSERTDRVTVVVGSDDEPIQFVATVADPDGDGRVIVVWNTTATQTADAAFSAGNGTTLVDVARRRPRGDVSNISVNGDYVLSLYDGDSTDANEVDVGVAVTGTNEDAAPPPVEISGIDAPSDVDAGGEFQVAITVENTGDGDAETTVRVVRNGVDVATQDVQLAAGETEIVTLSTTVGDAGTYRYRVVAANASDEFEVEISRTPFTDATTTTMSATPTAGSIASTAGAKTTATTGGETSDATGTDASEDTDGSPGFGLAAAFAALLALAPLATPRD